MFSSIFSIGFKGIFEVFLARFYAIFKGIKWGIFESVYELITL